MLSIDVLNVEGNSCEYLHRESAFLMMSSFIDTDFRKTGRTTGKSLLFSLSSSLCLYRLLWTGLPTVGGSGRLNVFATFNFDWNGEFISGIGFNVSEVRALRITLASVMLRHRRNIGVVVVVSLWAAVALDVGVPQLLLLIDLILPLMIELNDVGSCALSSIDSISRRSMQSSSIDSIDMESDDKLLNERKQLMDFGEVRVANGIGFGGNALG